MKTELMNQMSILLKMVKPNLVKCEIVKGKDIHVSDLMKDYERYNPDDDIVVVTCENGYTYKINVTCNSDISIVTEVFNKMVYK